MQAKACVHQRANSCKATLCSFGKGLEFLRHLLENEVKYYVQIRESNYGKSENHMERQKKNTFWIAT